MGGVQQPGPLPQTDRGEADGSDPREYDNDDVIRSSFDLLQQKYKCCGVDGYQSWSRTNKNKDKIGKGVNYEVPKSCCVDPNSNVCEITRNLGIGGLVASTLTGTIY